MARRLQLLGRTSWPGMLSERGWWVLVEWGSWPDLLFTVPWPTFLFSFFSVCLSFGFLTIPYDTLRYFTILPREGKEVAVLFPRAYLSGTLGLRPLERGLNQMHVLKQNKKTAFSNSNYLQLTGIDAGISTVRKHFRIPGGPFQNLFSFGSLVQAARLEGIRMTFSFPCEKQSLFWRYMCNRQIFLLLPQDGHFDATMHMPCNTSLLLAPPMNPFGRPNTRYICNQVTKSLRTTLLLPHSSRLHRLSQFIPSPFPLITHQVQQTLQPRLLPCMDNITISPLHTAWEDLGVLVTTRAATCSRFLLEMEEPGKKSFWQQITSADVAPELVTLIPH